MRPYEEVYKSPFGQKKKEDAEIILQRIRDAHTAAHGWEELDAGVEQRSDGLWYAWRHHRTTENY